MKHIEREFSFPAKVFGDLSPGDLFTWEDKSRETEYLMKAYIENNQNVTLAISLVDGCLLDIDPEVKIIPLNGHIILDSQHGGV